jgi:D-alanine transaminase
MPRIAYVNGAYVPFAHAQIHIEDRGYQFADGVYEVVQVLGGRLIDETSHLARLERSLREMRIAAPVSRTSLRAILGEVVRRNRVGDGIIYIQITRGVAPRDHGFPRADVKPAIVITAKRLDMSKYEAMRKKGVAVVTTPDLRWARCDIKSVSLLPNVLAKQMAREKGAFEAWLVDEGGFVREGSSTTAWIVTKDGQVRTRQLDHHILPGCTREVLLEVARAHQIRLEERAFTVAEALAASEAFLTAASIGVLPITRIDGSPVGNGDPGPVSRNLHKIYSEAAMAAARSA